MIGWHAKPDSLQSQADERVGKVREYKDRARRRPVRSFRLANKTDQDDTNHRRNERRDEESAEVVRERNDEWSAEVDMRTLKG